MCKPKLDYLESLNSPVRESCNLVSDFDSLVSDRNLDKSSLECFRKKLVHHLANINLALFETKNQELLEDSKMPTANQILELYSNIINLNLNNPLLNLNLEISKDVSNAVKGNINTVGNRCIATTTSTTVQTQPTTPTTPTTPQSIPNAKLGSSNQYNAPATNPNNPNVSSGTKVETTNTSNIASKKSDTTDAKPSVMDVPKPPNIKVPYEDYPRGTFYLTEELLEAIRDLSYIWRTDKSALVRLLLYSTEGIQYAISLRKGSSK